VTNPAPDSFLILMADQLAAAWLPFYGHPVAQAPALSQLAAGATVFESAYCPYPLCAPSRASMLTGRHASSVGVYDNAAEMRASVPTAIHALRSAGYETTVAGKMHFVGPDQLHGFEERLTTDIYPGDVDWTPDWSRPSGDPMPWYHTMEPVLTPGVCAASMQTDYDEEVAFHAARKLRQIARRRDHQPFLLLASFTHPHDPWELPRRYWDRYRPEDIELPAVSSIPLEQADPHSRRLRAMYGVDAAGLTEAQIRRARHGYFAAISYLDERIGQVLSALRESGLEERTTVLFCTDHGEMLGERGLWYKMAFFEPSARIPLLVRRPGAAGQRISQPVSLMDVAPTLLELAGVSGEGLEFDGASLAETVTGGAPPSSRPVISEFHAEGVQSPAAMLRLGCHKLMVCGQDPDLLYDLDADPLELRNLAAEPAAQPVVAELRAALSQRLDLDGIDRRVRVSQRERTLVARALKHGRYTSWDYQPPAEAATQYIRNREDLYELQRRARLDEPGAG
jgi:choline-sulfatase